ncbi:MAG: restriction endonuclease subunit S, partial [Nanoarchaeota archaeon]|nr:restriction endonuclease subunit S [Nanoarchaeota archaeon]
MPTWNNVKVGSFLTERKNRFKPAEANEMGLKRLYKIDFSGRIHLLDDKETNTGMILVKKGDLVISGINVEKGAISVYQGDEDVLATIHYSSYNFDNSQIDIDYFKWFLKSQTFKEVMQSQVRGGIKTELKPKNFLPLKIDLPDLPTQEAIRDRINNVSGEIKEVSGLNIKNEDYVNKLRQSILQEAVSGKLVPQDPNDEPASVLLEKIKDEKGKLIKEKKIRKESPLSAIKEDEIPFELPKGWEWVRLQDVFDVRDGTHDSPKYVEEGVPLVTSRCFENGNINFELAKNISLEDHKAIIKRSLVERDDILFSMIGGNLG